MIRFSTRAMAVLVAVVAAAATAGTAGSARAETFVGGTLRGEHQWLKQGSPYIVTSDVIIAKGASLFIGEGVTVRFKKDMPSREGVNIAKVEILVRGSFVVEGADRDTVYFTSDSNKPQWTDWGGIIIDGPDARAELHAAIVEFAIEGITVRKGHLKASSVTVRGSSSKGISFREATGGLDGVFITQVGNIGGSGIGIVLDLHSMVDIKNSFIVGVQNGIAYARNSGGVVSRTVVSNCFIKGILIRKSHPEFRYCTVTENDFGFVLSAGAKPKIHNNNIFDNHTLDVSFQEYSEEIRMDLTGNWWGETFPGLIEERIHDALDDKKVKVVAVIEPFLTEATTPQGASTEDK